MTRSAFDVASGDDLGRPPSGQEVMYDTFLRMMDPDDTRDEDVRAPFEEYADDPVGFVRKKIRPGRDLYPYQVRFLESFVDPDVEFPRVVWRANRGAGKTAAVAFLIIWWLCTRPMARVMMIAPSIKTQLNEYLIPEIKKWVRSSWATLPLDVQRQSVRHEHYGDEWKAVGVQSEKTEKIEGMHEKHVLVVIEEAKAVPKEAVESAAGTQTDPEGDNAVAMISIPGPPVGAFYDAFHGDRAQWTAHLKSDAFDAIEAGALRESWEQERREAWGADSPRYKREVLAQFAEDSEDALWNSGLIKANRIIVEATEPEEILRELRERHGVTIDRIVVGLDPSISDSEDADEAGIVVAGAGVCGHCRVATHEDESPPRHGFVLEDLSGRMGPEAWAALAVDAFHRWGAALITPEKNQGGDMVERTIATAVDGEMVPVKGVWAKKGKALRAEPVAAMDHRGEIHHVGKHTDLESQMTTWSPVKQPRDSPDRVDARVYSFYELFPLDPGGEMVSATWGTSRRRKKEKKKRRSSSNGKGASASWRTS